jgi:hypothetical protein
MGATAAREILKKAGLGVLKEAVKWGINKAGEFFGGKESAVFKNMSESSKEAIKSYKQDFAKARAENNPEKAAEIMNKVAKVYVSESATFQAEGKQDLANQAINIGNGIKKIAAEVKSRTRGIPDKITSQSEQVYDKTLAMAPKDLTLTDDQRVAKALIAAKFDAATVAAVIENGSPKTKDMEESAKGDYAQGVVKAAEVNKENENSKLASAGKTADQGIQV